MFLEAWKNESRIRTGSPVPIRDSCVLHGELLRHESQCQSTFDAGFCAQGRCDDVAVKTAQLIGLDISVQLLLQDLPDFRKHVGSCHDASTENDLCGRKDQDVAHEGFRHVLGDEVEGFMVVWDVDAFHAGSSFVGRTCRKAFQAVLVIRAGALIGISWVLRDQNMTHFRMKHAVVDFSVDDVSPPMPVPTVI